MFVEVCEFCLSASCSSGCQEGVLHVSFANNNVREYSGWLWRILGVPIVELLDSVSRGSYASCLSSELRMVVKTPYSISFVLGSVAG